MIALSNSVKEAQQTVDGSPRDRRMVYLLTSPSGKSYVGVTNDITRRIRKHLREKFLIGNALRKYTLEAFSVSVLVVADVEYAYSLEKKAIQEFVTLAPHGYNLVEGGLGGSVGGEKNPNFGRKRSKETRQKLREIGLRRKPSAETRTKTSAAMKGKRHSDETKRKMSESMTGLKRGPMPAEHRQKISEAGKVSWARRKASA